MENTETNLEFFTCGGRNNDEEMVFYKDLPKEILCKLDISIIERAVHLDSQFAKAALKGGYDPEKVSYNTLVEKGLLKDLKSSK